MSFFGELKRRNVLRVEATGPCQQERAQRLEGVINLGYFR